MKNKFKSAASILRLAANDFKAKYAGSALGIIWAIAEPLVTVVIYWFVYSMINSNNQYGEIPYYLWLSAGLAPWLFISNGICGTASAFRDYSFLVKKMYFSSAVLPVVRTASALMSHLIFLGIVFIMCTINGICPITPSALIPIFFCIIFVLSAGNIAALCCARFKDIQHIVSILLNIGFWLTPVFWNGDGLSGAVAVWLKINPAAIIINGYRNAIFFGKGMSLYDILFLSAVCCVLLAVGKIYQRAVLPTVADRL